ncbi:MAG: hypothetical protein JO224_13085 [Pelomonas sp.]|nr:hypothetical protein [Roseateles sp.]
MSRIRNRFARLLALGLAAGLLAGSLSGCIVIPERHYYHGYYGYGEGYHRDGR